MAEYSSVRNRSRTRRESNPQLVHIVPNEVVVMVSFEVALGQTRGMINLCIPFNTIERVASKLTSSSWVGYAGSSSSDETTEHMVDRLDVLRSALWSL